MITWTITQTNYETANGFITTAHWTATAVDEGYTASIWSTWDWCYASGVDKDATEAALAQQIALQKNPVTATGTPWSQA